VADSVHVYEAPGEQTSPKWCAAFARGCGGEIVRDCRLRPGAIAIYGSPKLWPIINRAIAEDRDWYYGDNAYFGRGKYYRVTRGAIQHTGEGQADPARFLSFNIPIKDWRKRGSHILLCPQSEAFFELHGFKPGEWVEKTTRELRKHTDRQIKVRLKADAKIAPIARALNDCWAVVTFTSNSAVDAVLAGIPAFTTGRCAASRMTLSDLSKIESPAFPKGRLEFAAVLAANQWTIDEMASGKCWKDLRANEAIRSRRLVSP
jgi:hypothetical protein